MWQMKKLRKNSRYRVCLTNSVFTEIRDSQRPWRGINYGRVNKSMDKFLMFSNLILIFQASIEIKLKYLPDIEHLDEWRNRSNDNKGYDLLKT